MKLKSLDKTEKIMVGCGGTALFGIIFGWAIFPKILNVMLKKQMTLLKGTDIRDMWTVFPFPLEFKVYIFNYTNPEEVMNGAKPILKEVGPYYYEEWKTKVNMEDIEDEDAIYYNRQDTFLFNRQKSGPGLTGNEKIVMPNSLVISIVDNVVRQKPEFLKLVKKAIDGVFNAPTTVFETFTVSEFLFDGVPINCNTTEFAPKALCTALKKEKGLRNEDGKLSFSLFGMRNGTVEDVKFKVLRGKRNIMDVGRMLEWNGSSTMQVWGGSPCNDLIGTDGTVFPPFLTEKDDLESFAVDICRSLPAKYERKSAYRGIAANRYTADFGDLANEPENRCFCESPTSCPPKGVMDASPCMKAPIAVSLPHYLNADPALLDSIVGLAPNVEEHGIFIDFEPISGTPLQARKRVQLNLVVPHVEKYPLFQGFNNTILPAMWIEEGFCLNKTFVDMLNHQLFYVLKAVSVIKWLMVISGSLGTVGALIVSNKGRLAKFAVKPVAEANRHPGISTIERIRNS